MLACSPVSGRKDRLHARGAIRWCVPLVLGAALTVACADDDPVRPGTASAARIEIVSGDDQAGFPRRSLKDSLRVKVASAAGAPVAGATVLWETSDGTVEPERSLTNAAGIASAAWSPDDAAAAELTAHVLNRNLAVDFGADVDGFVVDCVPDAVANDQGDLRAIACGVSSVGEFTGLVTLSKGAGPAGVDASFTTSTLDLTQADGLVMTSVTLSIGLGVPSGVHPVELRAVSGADTASAKIVVTVL